MTNPYQPPQESSENRLAQLSVPGTYFGGFWGVTALAILAGVSVAVVMQAGNLLDRSGFWAFTTPAIAWIATFVTLMWMLRGGQIQASTRILLPLLLAIPAYILYVPVCTFSAMFSTAFMGSDNYAPTFPGLILSSVVAFVGILLLFAAALRYRFKRPVDPEDPSLPATGQSDFTTPKTEPSSE